MALPAGSSAIDTADDSRFFSTDQRGIARPQGPHSDIGAFEFRLFSADLTLSSQASETQVVAGSPFTYFVQLANNYPMNGVDTISISTASIVRDEASFRFIARTSFPFASVLFTL
jgi:hypothetical protein